MGHMVKTVTVINERDGVIFKCSWVYFLVFKARLLGLVLALTFTLLSGPLVSVYADNDDDDVFVDDDDDDDGGNPMDQQLRELLVQQGVTALDPGPAQNPAQVDLGQALFFDWELSGNRDIACATCHHPFLGTGDGLSLPIGTGAVVEGVLGPLRQIGAGREFVPRNAPEIFNRGSSDWFSQFWDSRIVDTGTDFISPAGAALPEGLPSVLAVQAMFPVTSRDEMRGHDGDVDINGGTNELGELADNDLQGIWDALMARLLSIPEYQTLFADAFPGETLGFQHAAIAIAAFEAEAYTFLDSPWDNYVAGNNQALSAAEKRGALLFFGKAKCANCHSGSLLTDQDHHNIGVPQFGPGKGAEAPLDHGRGRETGDPLDLFRFRTPPLRNCEVTGPYMHNGAYNDLEDVVRHHASPLVSLLTYDPDEQLGQVELRDTYSLFDQLSMAWTIESSKLPRRLSKKKVRDLVRFLKTLTAPNIQNRMDATLPLTVPSGLPVDGVPTTP